MIVHSALQWEKVQLNSLSSNSQDAPHTSPRQVSYGLSITGVLEKIHNVMDSTQCIIEIGCWLLEIILLCKSATMSIMVCPGGIQYWNNYWCLLYSLLKLLWKSDLILIAVELTNEKYCCYCCICSIWIPELWRGRNVRHYRHSSVSYI